MIEREESRHQFGQDQLTVSISADKAWDSGTPGEGAFGAVRAGVLELSNVDLSREFSDLVVMQRGYQASSQVIATANDMLQELFRMKAQ